MSFAHVSAFGGYGTRKCARAVAISPHLDDAVFSAGGTLALLADAGWDVTLVTCFTASVPNPTGFALSTQLDKGLSADVDYLALRRDEDRAAAADLGVVPVHLPLPEAPHRGYESAPELFAGRRDDDHVAGELAALLVPLLDGADLVLAPQALGDHVDHQVVTTVVASLVDPERLAWWRDVPYVRRHPDAVPAPEVAGSEVAVDVTPVLERRVRAARRYVTQTGFQFGGDAHVGPVLDEIARAEGTRLGLPHPAEVLTVGDAGVLSATARH